MPMVNRRDSSTAMLFLAGVFYHAVIEKNRGTAVFTADQLGAEQMAFRGRATG
jgi:transposase-like protein